MALNGLFCADVPLRTYSLSIYLSLYCRPSDGGYTRGTCPTPCRQGGGIVLVGKCPGNMPWENVWIPQKRGCRRWAGI